MPYFVNIHRRPALLWIEMEEEIGEGGTGEDRGGIGRKGGRGNCSGCKINKSIKMKIKSLKTLEISWQNSKQRSCRVCMRFISDTPERMSSRRLTMGYFKNFVNDSSLPKLDSKEEATQCYKLSDRNTVSWIWRVCLMENMYLSL